MRAQQVLRAAGDDQFGNLRREKTLEPAHALDLRHLLCDARLQARIPVGELFRLALDLILKRFHTQQRFHPGKELRPVNRFGKKVIGPGLDAVNALGLRVQRGDHDHRQQGRCRRLADFAAHVVSGKTRHHDVEQHDVRDAGRDFGQRFLTRLRRLDAVAVERKEVGQQLDVLRSVVDHEDGGRFVHAGFPTNALTVSTNSFTLIGLLMNASKPARVIWL